MLSDKKIAAAYTTKMQYGLSDAEALAVIKHCNEFFEFNEKQLDFMDYLFKEFFDGNNNENISPGKV